MASPQGILQLRNQFVALPEGHLVLKSDLAKAEFATLRLRLLKIAARVVETATRVRFRGGLSRS